MVLKCRVSLLDGSETEFEVSRNAKTSKLLDEVCKHLNIVEKDYFGLIYKGSKLQKAWMNLNKKIKKQISKRGKIEFEFCVKFYPTDPAKLKEEITRYQVCLQIRKDLAEHLSCSIDKLTHLLSYWLQSEYQGQNDNAKVVKDCLKSFKKPPKATDSTEFMDRVLTLYRERREMSSAEADVKFLGVAAGLRLYGIHFYEGKETVGNPTLVGIGAKGLTEVREGQIPVSHTWSRIKNIGYKNNKFKLKLLRAPANGDPRLKKSFLFDSESQVHDMWKFAVEHHVFFRVGEKDKKPSDGTKKPGKKKSSILRRLSSKKKSKTEADVLEESKGIKRNPPTVTRGSSLRRSASLRMSTSSESTLSLDRHQASSASKQGGGSYMISKEPQMDSESSSEAETIKSNVEETVEKLPIPETGDVNDGLNNRSKQQQAVGGDLPDGREYRDENLTEAVVGKIEGTASGGSSTLLLTETILEEDEEGHHEVMQSPRKRIYPVSFAPLRDERKSLDHLSRDGAQTDKKGSHPLEIDLDAEVVLSPAPSKAEEETFGFNPIPVTQESMEVPKPYRMSVEETLTTQKYTEISENVTVTIKHPKIDNVVKFKLDKKESSEEDGSEAEEPAADDHRIPTFRLDEPHSSSATSNASTEEGEIHFNAEEGRQILELPEDEPLNVQSIPIPTLNDMDHENAAEDFNSIKEYIPIVRKDSTEEETEDEGEIKGEIPLDHDRHSEEDMRHESEILGAYKLSCKNENEGFVEPEPLSFGPLSSDNLLLDYDKRDEYLTGEYSSVSAKDEAEPAENYEDDFETDGSEERRSQDENVAEIKPDVFEDNNFGEDQREIDEESDSVKSPSEKLDDDEQEMYEHDSAKMTSVKHEVDEKPPILFVSEEISYLDEDDFGTDGSEERRSQDEKVAEIEQEIDECDSVKMASVKHDVDEKPLISSVPKEISFRSSTRGVTIDFRMGENYKMTTSTRNGKGEKSHDGAASTTAATIGDRDDFEMEELDDDILYGGQRPNQKEEKFGEHRSEDDKEQDSTVSQTSPPGESTSRSSSLSDITDNTDELLQPNVLEQAWSYGAGLDEEDELFQVLFRTPPRRRKHRNRSEINQRDVEKGKREAMAFRITLDEEVPVSPRRRENLSKRPFIPSWPFDPMSLLDSRDLDDLDKDALAAARNAQRELMEESRRLEDIAMMDSFDFPSSDSFEKQQDTPKASPRKRVLAPKPLKDDTEFLGARSRSPSASPRMVGEEFIPGVPDFIHSVIPYQLPTPVESGESDQNSIKEGPVPPINEPIDPESMKFPQPIIRFSAPTGIKEELMYSPPPSVEVFPKYRRSPDDLEILGYSEAAVKVNAKSAAKYQATSSGRSTPQSGTGNTSQSEGATSSKSSSSSFPRFIHSVFPLRRSSSGDRRGRSKTRRKREKKITKQKNKKKHRSKSKDKKNAEQTIPVVEITAATDAAGFRAFPILSSPPHYSTLQQPLGLDETVGKQLSFPEYTAIQKRSPCEPKTQYDQESLDKIILSESDDAHSDSGTPETVRRAEDFKKEHEPENV